MFSSSHYTSIGIFRKAKGNLLTGIIYKNKKKKKKKKLTQKEFDRKQKTQRKLIIMLECQIIQI